MATATSSENNYDKELVELIKAEAKMDVSEELLKKIAGCYCECFKINSMI